MTEQTEQPDTSRAQEEVGPDGEIVEIEVDPVAEPAEPVEGVIDPADTYTEGEAESRG